MKKLLLTLLLTLLASVAMQAETVEKNFATAGYSNAADVEVVTVDDNITITFDTGTGSNHPKYYTSGSAVRCYNGNKITVTAKKGYKITDISFNAVSGNPFSGTYAVDGGDNVDSNSNAWSGEAQEVVFHHTDSTQFRFTSVTITYAKEADDTREEVKLSYEQTEYMVPLGETFEAPDLVCDPVAAKADVEYTSNSPSVAEVAADGTVTIKGEGVATIKASIKKDSENYKYAEAFYVLSVVDFSDPVTDLTTTAFKFSGTGYQVTEYSDSKYGVGYKAVTAVSNGFSMNTNANGKGSGVYVTKINNDVMIKSITLTWQSGNAKGVKVYASSSPIPGPDKEKTEYIIPDEATLVSTLSANGTVDINAYAFAVVPENGNVILTKISVAYEYLGGDGGERFEFDPFNQSYVLKQGETFKFELPEGAPEVTYESTHADFADVENNTIVAKHGGNTVISASWDAVPGKWHAGHETMAVSVAYEDLATMIEECNDGETYTGNFEVTVGLDHNNYNYVTDGTDWTLFYVNHNHGDGAVIPAGWSGKFTHYHGLPEFQELKHDEPSEAKGYKVEQFNSLDITEALVNEVVVLNDVVFAEATPYDSKTAGSIFTGVFDGKEYQFLNQFRVASVEAGAYNVKCAISYDEEDGVLIFPVEYRELSDNGKTQKPTVVSKKYAEGEELVFDNVEEGAVILYRHGGEDPDHTNVFTEAAVGAPMRAPADLNTTLTYNHDTHPAKYYPDTTLKFMAKAPGKAPSAVEYIGAGDDGIVTGVEDIVANQAEAVYYTLQGVRLQAAPTAAGVYIKVADGKSTKVVVK